MTPGAMAHTGFSRSSTLSGSSRSRWRVTKVPSTVLGPSESGVTRRLPSPTTSTGAPCSSGGRSRAISSPSTFCTSSRAAGSRRRTPSHSSVRYVPTFFPSRCAASSVSTRTSVMETLSSSHWLTCTPGMLPAACEASNAISVRTCRIQFSPFVFLHSV